MRLWHKDLIPYLPKQQLIGQWRECCLINKNILEKGTPNHILVNKIMNYDLRHFYSYCGRIFQEMIKRGYKADSHKILNQAFYFSEFYFFHPEKIFNYDLFDSWHTGRYLKQCLYNLEEKYDCGGIPEDEWNNILTHFIW